MEHLSDYFEEEIIVGLLCKLRAKHSHKRHKLHMMRDISFHHNTNKIQIKQNSSEFNKLQSFFPSRRNWLKLNEKERKKFPDSIKRVSARLYKTYELYKKKEIPFEDCDQWYKELIGYVQHVQSIIANLDGYEIDVPDIFGILKKVESKGGKIRAEYRPLAIYPMDDRIITGLTARYFTDFFDSYFLGCSFAFRSTKGGSRYTHHKSIDEILRFRKENDCVWVSECDIQKFFDTVSHEHLLKVLDEHIERVVVSENKMIDGKAIDVFKKFLNSFAFNVDVIQKNSQKEWWKSKGLREDGYFKWVEAELLSEYGNDYLNKRIGVPQGNAISCFVSNLILHNVDEKVLDGHGACYVRFCDDMILMHNNSEDCNRILEIYQTELKRNFLVYHAPVQCSNYLDKANCKEFWKSKSKKPYLWSDPTVDQTAIPWLSFVGYQLKYNQDIRVRRQSITKEKRKQVKEVENVLKALGFHDLRNPEPLGERVNRASRKSKRQIVFSLQQRLNSMSVGRIQLYNYKSGKQGLCWTVGFEKIKGQKKREISSQMKELDSFREKQIWRLVQSLKPLTKKSDKPEFLPEEEEEIYFGSPYSYHNYLNNFEQENH